MEFKGTKTKWKYEPPTEKFDSCTVSECGKIIGYCSKNSEEDRYNELLRSKAPEMLKMLENYMSDLNNIVTESDARNARIESVKQLIKEATTL